MVTLGEHHADTHISCLQMVSAEFEHVAVARRQERTGETKQGPWEWKRHDCSSMVKVLAAEADGLLGKDKNEVY